MAAKKPRISAFACTFYLKEFTKEMKEKEGKEPKVSDFVDAFTEMKKRRQRCQSLRWLASRTGENGTMHLQAYVQCKRQRISTFQNRLQNTQGSPVLC